MQIYDKAHLNIDRSFITRFKHILGIGHWSAITYLFTVICCYLIIIFVSIFKPSSSILKVKTFNYKYYIKLLEQKYNIKQQQ